MAAVIGRKIERMVGEGGASSSNEVYDPSNPSNSRGLQSPFALYYTITFFTNGIAIIGGVCSQFDLHRNCYNRFDRCDAWLFANAFFGVIHIGAAMYLVKKVRMPEVPIVTSTYGEDGKGGVLVTGYRLHSPRQQRASEAQSISGPPDSIRRIRYILCESKLFAIYIIVFAIYLCWHFFLDMRPCNVGMAFAMRCADIFIWAAPCAFIFSVGMLKYRQGRL
mmetsp:Transcript_9910/g.23902  ORF Transcript_9910/g.23902 Transcript_9910/m.23902 type:complete len:221 (+) Transcript_9910:325-987(+)|eukprot:CAMPEP_0172397346 /NCGR_PEP_ID=MMETSP1061-20121228/30006_1 /TAXON_ID=37318 /ORGANISM="Pseudo-nitzschia pungens, Strain cf. pungens" /LENGTH=220 /DNA_ID=CAMNT_0013129479 /DNA_START=277 /DNA_END=939 /DNA_ORIENTATION=+